MLIFRPVFLSMWISACSGIPYCDPIPTNTVERIACEYKREQLVERLRELNERKKLREQQRRIKENARRVNRNNR